MGRSTDSTSMEVSICTTVTERWEKLEKCLDKSSGMKINPHEILILDNSQSTDQHPVLEKYDTTVISITDEMGPSEARKRLSEAANGKYVFFIDADVWPKSNSIELLYEQLSDSDYRVASGIWTDYEEYYRRIGNNLLFDHESMKVLKQPISYKDVREFETVEIEFSTPQVMIESSLFDKIQFDPEYRFLYEWWDFFMQLNRIDEKILCSLDAEFVHEPGGYQLKNSTRYDNYQPERDKEYFTEKWGYEPVTTEVDDGNYNPSYINRKLTYMLNFADLVQKKKL
jgi:GT2 family glycosyltransferase